MPLTPPPPPPRATQAEHRPAPERTKSSKAAENYNQARTKATRLPSKTRPVGNVLQRYAKNPPDKRIKHTNRLHKRKQAKMRAKRKK